MTPFNERMLLSSKNKESRLVLALDVSGPFEDRLKRAERILELTGDLVAAVKVNHHLLLPYGLKGMEKIIKKCKRGGLPLIADLKLNDIESTNLNAVESLIHYGFDAVIANPFVGYEEGLGKAIERLHSGRSGILLLVYMSHGGAREGYSLLTKGDEPLYRLFAEKARTWGADGVIVSAKSRERIAEVRDIVGKGSLIFSPGVGPQGGAASEGFSSGADFIIVGRSVTEAPEPV